VSGQAQLSLVRQSPLIHGRFTFQDEVPGSSPGRPTSHSRRSQRCRQRAGSARCQPGPRWGRTPIPAGTPSGPSGPRPPGQQAPSPPPTVVAHPAQERSHAAAAATSRRSLLPAHSAAVSDGCSARRPGLPGSPAVTRGRARTQPGPGPPPTPLTTRDPGSIARVRACPAVDRVAPRRGSPPGLDPFLW
jgi:hypothetical protein